MANDQQEKREFFRLNFATPFEFKSYRADGTPEKSRAVSQNISQSGVLFQIETEPPAVSSLVWMNLDVRTLKICREIESRALFLNNGIVGKVVRVEEDPNNAQSYDVGVCFLTQSQRDSQEVQKMLVEISR